MLRRSETKAKHALRSLGEGGSWHPPAVEASHGTAILPPPESGFRQTLSSQWWQVPNATMYYVYLIAGTHDRNRRYIGFSMDLRQRLSEHNEGKLPNTAKYRPWQLVTYAAFSSKKQALAFERYLKSGSGHAFAKRRFW